MRPEHEQILRIVTGLLCFLVVMVGVRWQARAFRGDIATNDRRMKSAALLCAFCLIGIVCWFALSMVDPRKNLSALAGGKLVLGVGLLCVLFIAKTWLGPMLVTASLSWAVYMLFEYQELRLLPIFEFALRLLGDLIPQGSAWLYAALTLGHATIGSLYSAWNAPAEM